MIHRQSLSRTTLEAFVAVSFKHCKPLGLCHFAANAGKSRPANLLIQSSHERATDTAGAVDFPALFVLGVVYTAGGAIGIPVFLIMLSEIRLVVGNVFAVILALALAQAFAVFLFVRKVGHALAGFTVCRATTWEAFVVVKFVKRLSGLAVGANLGITHA